MTNKKTSQQANNVNESLGKKTHNFPRVFVGKLLGWHWQRSVLFKRIIIRQIDKNRLSQHNQQLFPTWCRLPNEYRNQFRSTGQKKKKWGASGKKEKQNQTPNELELELKLILQKIPLVFFIKKASNEGFSWYLKHTSKKDRQHWSNEDWKIPSINWKYLNSLYSFIFHSF